MKPNLTLGKAVGTFTALTVVGTLTINVYVGRDSSESTTRAVEKQAYASGSAVSIQGDGNQVDNRTIIVPPSPTAEVAAPAVVLQLEECPGAPIERDRLTRVAECKPHVIPWPLNQEYLQAVEKCDADANAWVERARSDNNSCQDRNMRLQAMNR